MNKSKHEAQKGNNMPTTNKTSTDYPCQNGTQSSMGHHSSENEKSSPESSEKSKDCFTEDPNALINGNTQRVNGPVNGYLHDYAESLASSPVDDRCHGEVTDSAHSPDFVVNCSHCSKYKRASQVNGLQNRKKSPKASRPKCMSWSRVVKHRKDLKENERRTGFKSKKEKYIYPELDTSSDDSCDCFSSPENGEAQRCEERSSTESEGDDKEYSIRNTTSECRPAFCLRTSEQVNGNHEQVQTVNLLPRFEDLPLSAPLAVPEDSDGSSQNSGCDSKEKETNAGTGQNQLSSCDNNHENKTSDDDQGIIGRGMLEIEKQVENVFTHVSSSESLEEIADEENSGEIPVNRGGIIVEEVTVPSSSESLDEIGDYIETDFPSRASRHMFASSSDHSSTSSDEDEGYGVNQERDLHNAEKISLCPTLPIHENGLKQSNEPHSPESCHDTSYEKIKENSQIPILDDFEISQADSFADITANLRYNSECQSSNSMYMCRPKYISNNSEESNGKPESDSSLIYSPETDFLDSCNSDVPTSATSMQQMFLFSQEMDNASVKDQRNGERNLSEYFMYDPMLDYASNDLQGAEGGVTNDLSMRRHSFEFDDVECNMESYDPHLCVDDNEHFNYLDTYKHGKVPQANFQNSESNRQEKVFFKELEKENRSAVLCDSSDEEENLSFCLRREHLSNVQLGHIPSENGHCMVLDDLENPTHAVRNAVIMPLPNKLDESSGLVCCEFYCKQKLKCIYETHVL